MIKPVDIRTISLIFGKTGSGKTVLAKKLVKTYIKEHPQNTVFIIDSLLEYENGIIVFNLNDLISYCKENDIQGKTFICRFISDDEIESLFEFIFQVQDSLLVVEEAEIYINPNSRNGSFLYLVRYGRHARVSIIGIARRVSELSLTFRAQTDFIYSFKQTDFNDISKMEKMGLFNVDKLPKYKHLKIKL